MLTKLALGLKDLTTPKDAALAGPPPVGTFVKGINLGGEAVTIEGYCWDSYETALAQGLTVPAATQLTTSVLPTPYATPDMRRMLNTVLYHPRTIELHQSLANGTYQVYLWILENYQTNWHSMTVTLGDRVVATEVGQLPAQQWARYGAYETSVQDGVLRVAISTHSDQIDAHVMGISLFQIS